MNTLEVLLVAINLIGLLGPLVPLSGGVTRWLDFLPLGAILLAIAHLVLEGFRPIMIPVYLITVLLFGRSLWRLIRRRTATQAARQSRLNRTLSVTSRLLGVVLLSIPVIFSPLVPASPDYSRMSWSAAFDATHAKLAREYPYGDWKEIDWNALYAEYAPRIATAEGRRIEQYRFLVRVPIGTEAQVTFKNPQNAQAVTMTLIATDDQFEMLNSTYLNPEIQSYETPIRSKILPSGHGYVKIDVEYSSQPGYDPESVMRRAVEEFIAKQVPGVILDVRGNGGGADDWVPKIVGFFFTEPSHYEYRAYYTQGIDRFVVLPPLTLTIQPLSPHYPAPVVVLVDNETISTGEGIPMAIQRLPQGKVMGFTGTWGSFGMSGGELYLPDGNTLYYPIGQSLDAAHQIQLDSNRELKGGVGPDIRVPWTEETVRQVFVDRQDVLLEAAVQSLQNQ